MSITPSFAANKSLYERLGGQGAIQAVVTKFISNVGGDKRINGYFATTDLKKLNKLLVEQVCMATGGPCSYSGRDMKTTHKGMKVTDAAFGALVGPGQCAGYLQCSSKRKGRAARDPRTDEERYRRSEVMSSAWLLHRYSRSL
ncbi:MAG: group 1 truncated hemoglobin [Nitrospira sp.]